MPQIYQMPRLLHIHLWEKYANIYATYEAAFVKDAVRIGVHS